MSISNARHRHYANISEPLLADYSHDIIISLAHLPLNIIGQEATVAATEHYVA